MISHQGVRSGLVAPVLGVETSCDETSAAILDEHGAILSLVIHSQDVHQVYGGVVPELAARDHLKRIEPVVQSALGEAGLKLGDLAAVAATAGPGLVGALLVGFSWAKATAYGLGVPFVPVHHMEGHLFGPILEDRDADPPFVALLVSGGHTQLLWVPKWGTYQLLGQTRDDAVGEAFDKVAKLLGLPYPGGPAIESSARSGDPTRFEFPRPMLKGTQSDTDGNYFDFSFSGLKTAVAQTVRDLADPGGLSRERDNLAAAFQAAAIDVLVTKTIRAVRSVGCERVLLGGGVAANQVLRARLTDALGHTGRLFCSSPRTSMDNGAMVARAGQFRLEYGCGELLEVESRARLPGMTPWAPPPGRGGVRPSEAGRSPMNEGN